MSMNKDQQKPIKSPYKAPEGYFYSFNAQVWQKIKSNPTMKVYASPSPYRVWLAAASVVLLAAAAWLFVFKSEDKINNTTATQLEVKPTPAIQDEQLSPQPAATIEEQIITQLVEQPQQAATSAVIAKSNTDISLAAELDAAGLIVMDVETELFDEIEILP